MINTISNIILDNVLLIAIQYTVYFIFVKNPKNITKPGDLIKKIDSNRAIIYTSMACSILLASIIPQQNIDIEIQSIWFWTTWFLSTGAQALVGYDIITKADSIATKRSSNIDFYDLNKDLVLSFDSYKTEDTRNQLLLFSLNKLDEYQLFSRTLEHKKLITN